MSKYIIEKSDGSVLGVVVADTEIPPGVAFPDGASSTTAIDLTLYGRGKLLWGERANENFVHLLENFNSSTPPPNPLQGQIWHDTTTLTLSYWDGTVWKSVSTAGSGKYELRNSTNGTGINIPSPPGVITFDSLTYLLGTKSLLVYLNGQKMIEGEDYDELTTSSITWTGVGVDTTSDDVLEFYAE